MCEAVDYIFRSFKRTEKKINIIQKRMRNQSLINFGLLMVCVGTIQYASATRLRVIEQDDKIEKLTNEIKKMNHAEGV